MHSLRTAGDDLDMPMRPGAAAQAAPDAPAEAHPALRVAGAATLLWCALAAAVVYLLARHRPESLDLVGLSSLAAGIAAPLCAIWLAALALMRSGARLDEVEQLAAEATAARLVEAARGLQAELIAFDRAIETSAGRFASLRAEAAAPLDELHRRTEELSDRLRAAAALLAEERDAVASSLRDVDANAAALQSRISSIPEALGPIEEQTGAVGAMADAVDARIQAMAVRLDELRAALDATEARARDAAAAATERMEAALDGADQRSAVLSRVIEARAGELDLAVERAMSRTEAAVETMHRAVEVQAAALTTSIEQAQLLLDRLGESANRGLVEPLASLTREGERLAAQLGEQETRARSLLDVAERGFGVLDARLSHAAQSTGGLLDRLDERLAATRERMGELPAPIADAQGAVHALESALASLRAAARAAIEVSGQAPSTAQRVTEAADAALSRVAALAGEVERLGGSVGALGQPFDAALDRFEAARQALAQASSDIDARLAEANRLAGALETSAEGAALASTGKLIEALGRIREVAGQAEATTRATFDSVVEEARQALAAAGDVTMRESFAEPVRRQLGELDAAAQAAAQAAQASAERLSRQLINIAETAAVVEARIAQADARLETASQEDLSRRADLIIEALNSASIDIAKALSNEVPDTAWAAYMKGNRGLFTRRAAQLLGRADARAVAKRVEEDGEFRESVRRYLQDFEALMRHAVGQREGGPLSVALLSSDVGKLYVALAQATERLRG